jgi:hypothetical protein
MQHLKNIFEKYITGKVADKIKDISNHLLKQMGSSAKPCVFKRRIAPKRL